MVCFLSITEETEVIFNSMDDDVEEAEDEITGALIDGVYIWDRLCLYIYPISLPMMNAG